MREIKIYVYPFQRTDGRTTRLIIDGIEIDNPDNRLHQFVVKKPVSKWLCPDRKKLFVWKGFFHELALELNASAYRITYYGTKEGYDEFSDEVERQRKMLEQDGRVVNVETMFKEYFSVRKAVSVLADAFDSVFRKAYGENRFDLSRAASNAKKNLTEVPCHLFFLGCSDELTAEAEAIPLLKTGTKHPRAHFVILGDSWNGGGLRELLPKLQNSECAAVFVPEKLREEAASVCGGVKLVSYGDSLGNAVESFLYSAYLPREVSHSIEKYYELAQQFEDYETDAYLIESSENIDWLFR